MIAMSLDIDQLQADLAANKPSHLVATMKLLRQQQMRQKKLQLSRQSSKSSSKVGVVFLSLHLSHSLTLIVHANSTENLMESQPVSIMCVCVCCM